MSGGSHARAVIGLGIDVHEGSIASIQVCGVDGGGLVQKVPKVYRCEGREDAIQKKLRWPSLSEGPSGYLMVLCPLTSI